MSQYIVDEEGKKTHIVLTIEEYEDLITALDPIDLPPEEIERIKQLESGVKTKYVPGMSWNDIQLLS